MKEYKENNTKYYYHLHYIKIFLSQENSKLMSKITNLN